LTYRKKSTCHRDQYRTVRDREVGHHSATR
jgi:hypothetical protein